MKRIKKYILYFKNRLKNGLYTSENKQEDIEKIYQNIKNGKRSTLYAGMDKRIALEIAAQFIATLSDSEFMELLKEEKLINDSQYKSLTRKYKDIDIKKESQIQSNWIPIEKAQENVAKGEEIK